MSKIRRTGGPSEVQQTPEVPESNSTQTASESQSSTGTADAARAAELAGERRVEHQIEGQVRETDLRGQERSGPLALLPNQRLVGEQRIGGHVITPSSTEPIPREMWDNPSTIVSQLTQNTAESPDGTARCGPSALLGGALMNGPDAAASSIQGAARGGTTLSDGERNELRDISSRVRGRTASFRDLSRAQDLMHRSGDTHRPIGPELEASVRQLDQDRRDPNAHVATRVTTEATFQRLQEINGRSARGEATEEDARFLNQNLSSRAPEGAQVVLVPNARDPNRRELMWQLGTEGRRNDSGVDDGELGALARRSFGWEQTRDPGSVGTRPLSTMMFGRPPNRLQNGQSATVSVPGRPGDPAAHSITIGRDREGNAYIYNPDPYEGDHTLVTGDRAVREALRRYEGRQGLEPDAYGRAPQIMITSPGRLAH